MQQISFANAGHLGKKRVTRREKFLSEMQQVVPWKRLLECLEPFYPKGKRGRPPIGLERMLRLYFVQQWYGLADEALEDAVSDSAAIRNFVGIDLGFEEAPDATTVLKFRRLLEKHQLSAVLLEQVNAHLSERGLLMREGSMVDATIINAPTSTKNKDKARDPEMHQTKKRNQWYHGMKAHIGADANSGLVHSTHYTPANEKRSVIKGMSEGPLKEIMQAIEKLKAKIRARVQHPFHIVKNLFKYKKTRYRGLIKNGAQLDTLFALANLVTAKKHLLKPLDKSVCMVG